MALSLIAQSMRGGEAPEPTSADAAEQGEAGVEDAATAHPGLQPAVEMPGPKIDDHPLYLDLGDRRVSVLSVHDDPRIVLFGDFLSVQECDRLVEGARARMQRSMTADQRTGADQVDAIRTSRGMFFEHAENATVAAIEARIARLLHWPIERGECLQVLQYGPGDRYAPHHDYFDPTSAGAPALLARGGQRRATLLMYLREPERGGETGFPELGLRFAARRGSALFFAYDRPHASTRTLHSGEPVLAGEKWVATKWLRENRFV